MHKVLLTLMTGLVMVLGLTGLASAADRDLVAESADAKAQFLETDESMGTFFNDSAAYAIFPRIGKGGLGIGGAKGKGLLFEGGAAVGETSLSQFTIGFQAGGQVYSEVIFFETAEAVEDFKAGKFEFSAQVSAVAAAAGVSRDAKYKDGIAVFTMAGKGLMYEASVGGQKFGYEVL